MRCAQCGATLAGRRGNARYCLSCAAQRLDACRRRYAFRHRRLGRLAYPVCRECGLVFLVRVAKPSDAIIKYCSDACRRERTRRSKRLLNPWRARPCGHCGEKFIPRSGQAKYCSACRPLVVRETKRRFKYRDVPPEWYESRLLLAEVRSLLQRRVAKQLGCSA